MTKLSVVIITKNEEKNIERCLKSVSWADEIIVLDSGSTDRTVIICKDYNCKVEQTEWLGFARTKQKALDRATHNWILSIDADEEVSFELKEKIQSILGLAPQDRKNGYRIKRRSWYLKGWIRHSGWAKDYPLRFFDKRKGVFNDRLIHESFTVDGAIGRINKLLYHYSYPDIKTHLKKIKYYGSLASEQKIRAGKNGSIISAVARGLFTFIQFYFFKAGFLDGRLGFILAINSAFSVYVKYLMLWEKSVTMKNYEK